MTAAAVGAVAPTATATTTAATAAETGAYARAGTAGAGASKGRAAGAAAGSRGTTARPGARAGGSRTVLLPGAGRRKGKGSGLSRRPAGRQVLVAEFVLCVVIIALSPLTDKHKTDTPGAWMKRTTAVMALFMLLGMVSSGGPKAAKAAAAFGALVTVVLAVSSRDVFVVLAKRFGSGTGDENVPAGPRYIPGQEEYPGVGSIIGGRPTEDFAPIGG